MYTPINPILYDVVVCEYCGYSALIKAFNSVTRIQADMIRSEISPNYKHYPYPSEPTLDEAIGRYKLALMNAMVKNGKDGERAYICMRINWLYKLKGDAPDKEKVFADLTLKGLLSAVAKEHFPIAGVGLGESTAMYLIGAYSFILGDDKTAIKTLSELILSSKVSSRLKDMAMNLRDDINEKKREAKADAAGIDAENEIALSD